MNAGISAKGMRVVNDSLVIDAKAGQVWQRQVGGGLRKVGFASGRGYLRAQVQGKQIYLHRLIYSHVHGPISPSFEVDHINCNRSDNRIENLRLVTRLQNQENRKGAQKNSSTGVRGVYWHKSKNKYMAKIKHKRKDVFLGYFADCSEAAKAYSIAAARLHTHNPLAA